MKLLLDPAILSIKAIDPEEVNPVRGYWTRLIEWGADNRVHYGEASRLFLESEAAQCLNDPEDGFAPPRELKKDAHRYVNNLLLRNLKGAGATRRTLGADYLKGMVYEDALLKDLSGALRQEVVGIATDQTHWDLPAGVRTVQVSPPPPPVVELCFNAKEPLQAETTREVHQFFSAKHLHVVGPKLTHSMKAALKSDLGLPERNLTWHQSEKAKPIKDLDDRWRHLDPHKDITVCIYGKVGHSVSRQAEVAAKKAGVPHLHVQDVKDIVPEARKIATTN